MRSGTPLSVAQISRANAVTVAVCPASCLRHPGDGRGHRSSLQHFGVDLAEALVYTTVHAERFAMLLSALPLLNQALDDMHAPPCSCALEEGQGRTSLPWDTADSGLHFGIPWYDSSDSGGYRSPFSDDIYIDPTSAVTPGQIAGILAHEAGHVSDSGGDYFGHNPPSRFDYPQHVCSLTPTHPSGSGCQCYY